MVIAELRERHDLGETWFALNRQDAPIELVTLGGAAAQEPVAIGSISKSVTAMGVALLMQRRQLALEDTLGKLLTGYFRERGEVLHPSLEDITVQRLLTHTAGLRPNNTTDPVNGIRNDKVMPVLASDEHFFEYLRVSGAGVSNGSRAYLYSNISFLLLGLVIEAKAGMDYRAFCQQEIFKPLGIATAAMPPRWQLLAPFGGWFLEIGDIVKLWRAFDIYQSPLLTPETLGVLLVDIAVPTAEGGSTFYSSGAYIKRSANNRTYVLSHNGLSNFATMQPTYYAFVQMNVPGPSWAIAVSPIIDREVRRALEADLVSYVGDLA